jgi:hypothetical protein
MTEAALTGGIDPVAAFERTLQDAMNVTSLFIDDDSPMSVEDYLAATHVATQRLKAVSMFTMASIMSAATHKIPLAARQEFMQRIEFEESLVNEEEAGRRMLKTIRDIARNMNQN